MISDAQGDQAQYALQKAYSHSKHGHPASVNLLPPEILIRIFLLMCDAQMYRCPAGIDIQNRDQPSRPFFKQPVTISHVCSYWRRIAVSLAPLWSHIDLFIGRPHDPALSLSLEAYTSRAIRGPLDIHIILLAFIPTRDQPPPEVSIDTNYDHTLVPFLTRVAPHIRTLTLKSANGTPQGTLCGLILATLFAHCIAGVLVEVSIDVSFRFESDSVIRAHIEDGRLKRESIEAIWEPIKILRLRLCHIDFTSKAYHGLTELRLTRGGFGINQSDIIHVLRASPQIRVFELDAELDDEGTSIMPVQLDNLETLISRSVYEQQLGVVLRLIAPVSKPLSLSILDPYTELGWFPSKSELERFAARSNINRLCANGFRGYSQLAGVLSLMPTIRSLAVDYFKCNDIDEGGTPLPSFILDTLYVLRSTRYNTFKWPSIEKFVKMHNVRQLVLWKYDFRYCGLGKPGEGTIPDNLYSICPVVHVISDNEPNPIEEWC